jgi:hypothetical protein
MTVDSILQATKTVGAFILLLLVLLIAWVVVSPIAYALRLVLRMLGLPEALDHFATWLRTVTPVYMWGLGWSLLPVQTRNSGGELRLVVDQRLGTLQRAITSFADSTRHASDALVGLGSSTGPAGLAQQVGSLKADIEKLGADEMPYDIDDSFIAATAEEMSARSTRRILIFISLFIIAFNGAVLSEAFRNWGMNASLMGIIQLNIALAVAYVAVEMGVGVLLRVSVTARNWVFGTLMTLAALAAIAFEVYVTDQIGLGRYDVTSAADVSLIERHAFGLFGFILASVNCAIGYYIHEQGEILNRYAARQRIVRDAGQWNGFLASLPERLDKIRTHISRAQGSLDNYLVSVGGHSDSFTGAVDAVARDRETVRAALRDADMNDWPKWLDAAEGDRATNHWLAIGVAILTIGLGIAFEIAFGSQVQDTFPRGSDALIIAGTIGAALTQWLSGMLLYPGIQLLEAPGRQTAPLRMNNALKIFAATGIVTTIVAIWGFSIYAHGWRGLPVAALNSLLAAGLVGLGTQWDRFWRGLFTGAVGVVDIILAVFFLLMGLLVQIVGWVLVAIGKAVLFLLGFLGLPTEKILEFIERRKQRAQTLPA